MNSLDNRFFEEYKRLEKICSEMYDSRNGVSAYIANMESKDARSLGGVPAWAADYRSLKHVRWVRNQLAHDSAPGQLSTVEDMAFVQDFHHRILIGQDPLTLLEREMHANNLNSRKSALTKNTRSNVREGRKDWLEDVSNAIANDSRPQPQKQGPKHRHRLFPLLLVTLAASIILAILLFSNLDLESVGSGILAHWLKIS